MSTRISGLSLRATIGLAFAAVIVLVAAASAVTFVFQSKSAQQIGNLQGQLEGQSKKLKDSQDRVQDFLNLDKTLRGLDEQQAGLAAIATQFNAIQTRVREVGDQCQDEGRSGAERIAYLRALFLEQSAGSKSEFEAALGGIEAGLAKLSVNDHIKAKAVAYATAVSRFRSEVSKGLFTKVARRDSSNRVVGIDEVSIFVASFDDDEAIGDAMDAAGSSLKRAFARIRADEPKDDLGNPLPSVSSLHDALNSSIQAERLQVAEQSKTSSGELSNSMGEVVQGMVEVSEDMKEAQAEASLPNTVMIIVTIVVTILAIAATLWTSWMVSRPLRQLAHAAKQVTSGNLSSSIETNRTDEVGQLAEAFAAMVAEMNEILHEAQKVAEQVASSAAVLSSSAGGVMSQMDRQAAGITEASGLVEGVRDRSEAIRDHATGASHASNEVMSHSSEGQAVVSETLKQMVHVSSTVSDSAKIIDGLGEASQEIGNIVSTISEIADQTNLLALNAAIEAARAGEHGRGFAVVADEVRKLAVNVSKSANEIIELISRFKRETERAVSSMQDGALVVKAGVSSANQAGESLATIISAVQKVSHLMSQTDEATRDQVRATGEVRDTLGDLTKLSVSARDVAHRTAEEAAGMQQSVQNLRNLLSHFKLGRRAGTREVQSILERKERARASADDSTEEGSRARRRTRRVSSRDEDAGVHGGQEPFFPKVRRSGRLTQMRERESEARDADARADARAEEKQQRAQQEQREQRQARQERRDSERRSTSREVPNERRGGSRRMTQDVSEAMGTRDRRGSARRSAPRDSGQERRRRPRHED